MPSIHTRRVYSICTRAWVTFVLILPPKVTSPVVCCLSTNPDCWTSSSSSFFFLSTLHAHSHSWKHKPAEATRMRTLFFWGGGGGHKAVKAILKKTKKKHSLIDALSYTRLSLTTTFWKRKAVEAIRTGPACPSGEIGRFLGGTTKKKKNITFNMNYSQTVLPSTFNFKSKWKKRVHWNENKQRGAYDGSWTLNVVWKQN